MGINYRGGLIARAQLGLVKNLGAILRKASTLRVDAFREGIHIGMFTSEYLPYQASQTYRTIKTEFESRRSKALVEAQSQTFRL